MKRKKISIIILAAAFIIGISFLSTCGKSDKDTSKDKTTSSEKKNNPDLSKMVTDGAYFCPMHPAEQSNDSTARCPICKMKLESKQEYNKKMNDEHEALENKYEGKKDLIHFEVKLPLIKSDECEGILEETLSKDKGIAEYHIDILNRVVHMYIDKTKTSKSNIEKLISDAGFDANDVKANPEAAAKLPAECKQ